MIVRVMKESVLELSLAVSHGTHEDRLTARIDMSYSPTTRVCQQP